MEPLTFSMSRTCASAGVATARQIEAARAVRMDMAGLQRRGTGTARAHGRNGPLRYNRTVNAAGHLPEVIRTIDVPDSFTPAIAPVVLLILDGWGHREDPTDNALAKGTLPNWRALLADCPHTLIHTEGRHVGLPDGQ